MNMITTANFTRVAGLVALAADSEVQREIGNIDAEFAAAESDGLEGCW